MHSVISEIHELWRSSFFWKCSKVDLDFKNAEKKRKKVFCFLDNCIWIGSVKLSLLRREYLPFAVNVLTNSPEILHITKRNYSIFFTRISKYDKCAVVQISTVFGTVYHVACRRVCWSETFWTFSNHVFRIPWLQKYMGYEGHLFIQNVQSLI